MKTSILQKSNLEIIRIPNFKPSGGKHCWTTSLKNVLDYHGLNLSEEMIFGLGGGIGFIYWYMKFMPTPFIGTRYGKNMDTLVTTCTRIGAEASVEETTSTKKGYETLKRQLRKGNPALVFVDMAYMPYLALPEEAHFGAHSVVVYGVSEEQNTVFLSDRAQKPFTIGIEDLITARGSKFSPFPPKNRLLKIQYPDRLGNFEKGIVESIRDCCSNMISPPIKNFGLAGMQKWAGILPKWPQQFKGLSLVGCLFNVFLYIEVAGTGGSGFRTMYARFLSEARDILHKPALSEVSDMFRESAGLWSEIAHTALPDSWPSLGKIRELCLKKNRLFEEQKPDALKKMNEINPVLDKAMKRAAAELEKEKPVELLSLLQRKVLQCQEIEKKALETLASIIK